MIYKIKCIYEDIENQYDDFYELLEDTKNELDDISEIYAFMYKEKDYESYVDVNAIILLEPYEDNSIETIIEFLKYSSAVNFDNVKYEIFDDDIDEYIEYLKNNEYDNI